MSERGERTSQRTREWSSTSGFVVVLIRRASPPLPPLPSPPQSSVKFFSSWAAVSSSSLPSSLPSFPPPILPRFEELRPDLFFPLRDERRKKQGWMSSKRDFQFSS